MKIQRTSTHLRVARPNSVKPARLSMTLAIALCGASVSCGKSATARPDQIPDRVTVAGGNVEVGYGLGGKIGDAQVDDFRIGKTLVTVGHYRECVAASCCAPPGDDRVTCRQRVAPPRASKEELADKLRAISANHHVRATIVSGPTYSEDPADALLPVTCATPEDAAGYCAWVGGRLATPEEWLLAARGPQIHRYSWGDDPATCAQHPSARDCPLPADPIAAFSVGNHEAKSPSGVVDVLLTPTELVMATVDSKALGCQGRVGTCRVGSFSDPAAIDMMWSTTPGSKGGQGILAATYGFRCVWEGGR
jgi:hypothetical protein